MFEPKKIFDMLKNAGDIQKNLQEKLKNQKAQGSAGGDMVKIDINGSFEVEAVFIDESLLKDKEFLQDLVKAAFNDAASQIRAQMADQLKSIMPGIGF